MNWETFKSLNPELQQEYLFRFKDKPKLNCTGLVWAIMALSGSLVGLLMIAFIMIKDDAFLSVRLQIIDIVAHVQTILKLGVPVIIAYVLGDIFGFGWYYFKRYWWKKKWKIKKVKGNFWKRE